MFNKKKIDVIRIGLQSTDEICNPEIEGSQVVSGPYHPAFRQLVESRICYDEFLKKRKALELEIRNAKKKQNKSFYDSATRKLKRGL